ncbi:MAG: ATP-binding protein, partial [Candidatus Gracilibacteria bacterium]|nr:ATP-binding protein [Candidatus Gracilibacteria bacterium]
ELDDFAEDEIEKCNLEIFVKSKIASLKSYDFFNEVLRTLPDFLEEFLKNLYEPFKDIIGVDYYRKDIIDLTSLVKFSDQDLFITNESFENMLKLGGDSNKNKDLLGEIDLTKLKPKKLLLKPDLEELVDGVIDNISNIESYKKLGLGYPKGVLFFGNGGGGKTSLCNNIICLSESTKKKAFKLNMDKLLASPLGDSEKNVREIFNEVRKTRAQGYLVFLFIDEVDGIMNVQTGVSDPVSGTRSVILQELDGIDSDNDGIIILATTNHLDKLSTPFIRRFSVKANIVNPDKETIKKLFDLYINKFYKTIPENLDLEKLYNKSIGKAAGFVEIWVIEAIKYSIFKNTILSNECFDKTINRAEFEIKEKEKVVGFN